MFLAFLALDDGILKQMNEPDFKTPLTNDPMGVAFSPRVGRIPAFRWYCCVALFKKGCTNS